jgi:hypothetical protein
MDFKFPRTPDGWMSMVSAILLTEYFALALSALFSSSNDPQQGMAQGFITLVALILLLFGGALWFGVARQHPWVVRIVFAITIFPALSQIARKFTCRYVMHHSNDARQFSSLPHCPLIANISKTKIIFRQI